MIFKLLKCLYYRVRPVYTQVRGQREEKSATNLKRHDGRQYFLMDNHSGNKVDFSSVQATRLSIVGLRDDRNAGRFSTILRLTEKLIIMENNWRGKCFVGDHDTWMPAWNIRHQLRGREYSCSHVPRPCLLYTYFFFKKNYINHVLLNE